MSRSDYLPQLRGNESWVVWGHRCRDCGAVIDTDERECSSCGGEKTKPPLAPFDGRRNAKSNDPETWRSYEEAVAYHDRDDTDTEGIGYMLSKDGIVVGVDLDGCRHPDTGELEPWAEDIIDRLDTYAEVSPSGTGVRLFVIGLLPEGRRKRKQDRTLDMPEWVREEKNAEIEVYETTRYMTYTGDHLDGTPAEANQRASAIREIHSEYVADSDDSGSSDAESSASGDMDSVDLPDDGDDDTEEFTNELGESLSSIRERDGKLDALLTDLEPDYSLPHDDDSASGYDFAAASKLHFWRFSDADIGRILRRCRRREKLKRDDYLKRTIANAKGDEQYEPNGPAGGKDPAEAAEVLDDLIQRYEGADDDPGGETERRMYKLLAAVAPDEFDDYGERVASVADAEKAALERHRDHARHRSEYGPILVENGRTWYLGGSPLRRYELLNFELAVDSFLETPDEPLQAKLTLRAGDQEIEKTVTPRVFKKRQRWEDDVLAEQFGLRMEVPGPASHPDDLLDDLNEWVQSQDAPRLTGTKHLGRHGDEFVLPDGSLTADGWLDEPSTVYLEREIEAERRVRLSADEDAEYDERDVRAILRDLPFTRDVSRFLPVLGWFYATSFRPWIMDWEGEFNLLSVTGGTGSGKTTTLGYLNRCFGLDAEPLSVDTYFATLTSFASSNALPVWFDEYKPSDMSKSRKEFFHRFLRKTTKGQKEQRGRADGSTRTHTIAAPAVVSGEQKIQGTAERRRSIMTTFRQDVTDRGTETRQVYKRLAGQATLEDGDLQLPDDAPNPTAHSFAWYRWTTEQERDEIRQQWHSAKEFVAEARAEWDEDHELDDLEIQGLQTVVFGWRLYEAFAEEMSVRPDALPDDDDLRAALRHVADAAAPTGARKNHEDEFVELLSRAASADYLAEGKHYTHVKEGRPVEQLRFNMARCYDAVSKYVRDHGLDGTELLGVDDYRERFADRADEDGHYVKKYSHPTQSVGRAVGIATVEVADALEYDPYSFARDEPVGGESKIAAKSGGSDDDDSGGDTAEAAADGGEEIEDMRGSILSALQDGGEPMKIPELLGAAGVDPGPGRDMVSRLAERGDLAVEKRDGDAVVMID